MGCDFTLCASSQGLKLRVRMGGYQHILGDKNRFILIQSDIIKADELSIQPAGNKFSIIPDDANSSLGCTFDSHYDQLF